MKVKLYKKFLSFVAKKIERCGFDWIGGQHPLRFDRASKLHHSEAVYQTALGCWINYGGWYTGTFSHAAREVAKFKKKHEKRSRKYWTAEARLKRILESGDDD